MKLLSRCRRCSSAGRCGIVMGTDVKQAVSLPERRCDCQLYLTKAFRFPYLLVLVIQCITITLVPFSSPGLTLKFFTYNLYTFMSSGTWLSIKTCVICWVVMIQIFRLKTNFAVVYKWLYYIHYAHITYLEKIARKSFSLMDNTFVRCTMTRLTTWRQVNA